MLQNDVVAHLFPLFLPSTLKQNHICSLFIYCHLNFLDVGRAKKVQLGDFIFILLSERYHFYRLGACFRRGDLKLKFTKYIILI